MTAPEVFQVRDGDGWEVYVTNPAGGWWLLGSVGGYVVVDTLPDGAEAMVAVGEASIETQYGVEATLLIDGGREVQGPYPRGGCEARVQRQLGKSWVADGTPLDPVLVTREVISTPWTPVAEGGDRRG